MTAHAQYGHDCTLHFLASSLILVWQEVCKKISCVLICDVETTSRVCHRLCGIISFWKSLKPCSHRRFCRPTSSRPTLAHCVGRLFRSVHTHKTTSADFSKQCTRGAEREKNERKKTKTKKISSNDQASDGAAIFGYCGSTLPFHWPKLNLSGEVRQKSADKSGKYRHVDICPTCRPTTDPYGSAVSADSGVFTHGNFGRLFGRQNRLCEHGFSRPKFPCVNTPKSADTARVPYGSVVGRQVGQTREPALRFRFFLEI